MKKVIIGSSALAGVAVISAIIWWWYASVTKPLQTAETTDLSSISITVRQLKAAIDTATGYQQMGLLSSGDSNAWQEALQDNELAQGPIDLENEIPKCTAPTDVKQKLVADAENLKKLYEIAFQEYKAQDYPDCAQALQYFHRVTEDINYYITQSGEHYEVSHILGGYQTVENFIHNHLN